ncbi:MAG: DUF6465 family protein [Lachnospiraceae bacterium]
MKAKVIKKTAGAATGIPEVKAAPAAAETAIVKTVEAKETPKEEVKEEPAKKETKTTARKSAAKTRKTASEKKPAAKAAAKKVEVKTSVTVQFEGKSYSQEELIKIAKDVWKFDLKKKVGDLKSVELYVKPEENTCYYVMNDEIAGSFAL